MKFEEIYNAYWQKIFRLCMGYINDSDLAKDMAQETFITVWEQLPKFRNESKISTWIYRIATNNCLKQIEREKRLQKAKTDVIHHDDHPSLEPQIQLLYKYISQLAELDRIIISLELENMNQAEIANVVGLTEINVRVRIHRIKKQLNQKFKENE